MATSLLQFAPPTKPPEKTPSAPKKDIETGAPTAEEDFESRLEEIREKRARKKQEEAVVSAALSVSEPPLVAKLCQECEATATPLNPPLTAASPIPQKPFEQTAQQTLSSIVPEQVPEQIAQQASGPVTEQPLKPIAQQAFGPVTEQPLKPIAQQAFGPVAEQVPEQVAQQLFSAIPAQQVLKPIAQQALSSPNRKQAAPNSMEPVQAAAKTAGQENGVSNFLAQIEKIIDGEGRAQTISIHGQTTQIPREAKASTMASALPPQTATEFDVSLRHNLSRLRVSRPLHSTQSDRTEGQKPEHIDVIAKEQGIQVAQQKTNLSGQNSGEQNSPLPGATSFTTGINNSAEATAFPQLFSSSLQVAPLPPPQQTGQASVLLPSGNIVYEEEVLQQVTEKFHTNNARTESRINLHLNPEELGKLKIDLVMKEGAVRVNVITHNRQAQDILERNMARLKNVLEKQGITVSEVTISQAEESPQESQLFGEHFSGNSQQGQQSFKEKTGHFAENLAEARLGELIAPAHINNESTVNLTA